MYLFVCVADCMIYSYILHSYIHKSIATQIHIFLSTFSETGWIRFTVRYNILIVLFSIRHSHNERRYMKSSYSKWYIIFMWIRSFNCLHFTYIVGRKLELTNSIFVKMRILLSIPNHWYIQFPSQRSREPWLRKFVYKCGFAI